MKKRKKRKPYNFCGLFLHNSFTEFLCYVVWNRQAYVEAYEWRPSNSSLINMSYFYFLNFIRHLLKTLLKMLVNNMNDDFDFVCIISIS